MGVCGPFHCLNFVENTAEFELMQWRRKARQMIKIKRMTMNLN